MTGPPDLPEGRLLQSRVVPDPGETLADALDRPLTGYVVFEPEDALLLDTGGSGVIAFREGVPVAAHYGGTDRGGPEALADLAVPGPYSAEIRETDDDALAPLVGEQDRRIPPGMAAERLAGDPDLADRTRTLADRRRVGTADPPGAGSRGRPRDDPGETHADPVSRPGAGDRSGGDGREGADAIAAFLEDERKIEAIREQASQQARERAEDWGLTDHLEESPDRRDRE